MGAGIDAQAQAHYNRVIADGGLIPSGLVGVNNFFKTVKGIYGTSDITTAISVGLDAQVLGYKLGAGAGTTAGQAAQKLYSCSGASGDVVQTTAASQPLLLVHSGANYWFGSGVTGNYCGTPNATANQITGDIEFTAKIKPLAFSGTQSITAKWSGGNAYIFALNTKTLSLYLDFGAGAVLVSSTSNLPYNDNDLFFVKATRQSSTGNISFFYKTLSSDSWTQLGTTITSTTGAFNNINQQLEIGTIGNGGNFRFTGSIYNVTISNSIGGAPVVDFNPSQYNAATSQTQWTSSTGEVWTINTGTATTGYKGVLVDRTEVQGDGVDDTMQTTSAIWTSTSTVYSAINFINLDLKLGTSVDSDTANSSILRFEGLDTVNNYFAYQGGIGISRNISARKNLLTLYNSVRNNTSSALNFNNGTNTTGTLNTVITTGVKILGNRSNTPAYFTNGNLNTILISNSANNSTVRTAMYNYIRSINNNAF
jgi:hypothetical protein